MQDVYQALLKIRPLRPMRGLSQKKRYSNAPIVIRHSPKHATWRNMETWEDPPQKLFQYPEFANSCFSIAGYLKEHMGTNSGEIPFKYKNCDKSFSPSNYLETQEKSHSSAQSVTSVFQDQVPWRSMKGSTQKRSLLTAQSVTRVSQ